MTVIIPSFRFEIVGSKKILQPPPNLIAPGRIGMPSRILAVGYGISLLFE
jgi:hypothetical protein